MLSEVLILFLTFLVFLLLKNRSEKELKNYPAGPPAVPIFGNLLNFSLAGDLNIDRLLIRYAKIYGNIFSLKFGEYRGIVLSDVKLSREAFNNLDLVLRPVVDTLTLTNNGKFRGMFVSSYEHVKEQRRFLIRELVNHGFGKSTMEQIIVFEAEDCVNQFEANLGKPIKMQNRFNVNVFNVLWQIMGSTRYETHDKELNDLIHNLTEAATDTKSMGLFFLPWLIKYLPNISGWERTKLSGKKLFGFLEAIVKNRVETHEEGSSHDFIAAYIEEIRNTRDAKSSFYGQHGVENLIGILGDVFVAGADTTSNTISWALLYLAVNEEVQTKVQREIDSVLGKQSPSIQDRKRMPYTEAFIRETLRHSTVAPLGLPHWTTQDTQIGGYDIPKDTIIMANFYAIHHDDELWDSPEEFRPERFLTPDGYILKHDTLVPFAFGKRSCPAETLARDELFIFIVTVVQRFSLDWNRNLPKPSYEAKFSFSRAPLPYELIFQHRTPSQELFS